MSFCCDIKMVGSEFGINVKARFHHACINCSGSWCEEYFPVVPLVPTEHHLKATALLSVVAYRVHPIMTTAYLSFNGCFQQNNAVCHKTLIISKLVGVVEWKLHIIDVQMAYLQQMWDAIISTWTKISEMFPAPC